MRFPGTFLFLCIATCVAAAPLNPGHQAHLTPEMLDTETSRWLLLDRLSFRTDQPLPAFPAPFSNHTWVDTGAYAIVQFHGTIQPEDNALLDDAGATILDYLPVNGYVVHLPSTGREIIEAYPETAWVGPWSVPFRVATWTEEALRQGNDAIQDLDGKPLFTFRIARTENVKDVAEQLAERMNGEVTDIYEGAFDPTVHIAALPGSDLFTRIVSAASVDGVLFVDPQLRKFTRNNPSAWVTQSWEPDFHPVWDQGIFGADQIVCVADTGLDWDHCFFYDAGQPNPGPFPNPNNRKVVAYHDWAGSGDWDANGHGTHVAGSVAGDDFANLGTPDTWDGMAPQARITIQDVGTGNASSLSGIPGNLNNLFDQVYPYGTRFHTNSWGSPFNGYTTHARNVDEFTFAQTDFTVLFANGNDGPGSGSVGEPATAKNAISVGATYSGDDADFVTDFSSRGETDDGRTKPTLVTPGIVRSARSDRNVNSFNCDTFTTGGTSMACPIAAGNSALVRQYFMDGFYPTGQASSRFAIDPSNALIKGVMVNSSRWIRDSEPAPDQTQGWGRLTLDDALYFAGDSRKLDIVDNTTGVDQNKTDSSTYSVLSGSMPLKVTLVWMDRPGSSAAGPKIVNDLDLIVTAPDGSTFKGNVFTGGVSDPDTGSHDRLNVVEQVFIDAPAAGVWMVDVIGHNVPQESQPYAVVVTGDLGFSIGSVQLDAEKYACNDQIVIAVQDTDLRGQGSVSVEVTSSTEQNPESLMLTENAQVDGLFEGTMPIQPGVPSNDGVLQVNGNDVIQVTYIDASDGVGGTNLPRVTEGTVDCAPPNIFNVEVTPLSQTAFRVTWETNENTESEIHFGDQPPFANVAVSTTDLGREHEVEVTGQQPCSVNLIEIQATDVVGNMATDTNGGTYYRAELPQELVAISEGAEGGAPGWTLSGTWSVNGLQSRTGAFSFASGHQDQRDVALTSPVYTVPVGLQAQLRFYTKWDIEDAWDAAQVEISVSGGPFVKLDLNEGYPGRTNSNTDVCVGRREDAFTGTQMATWEKFTSDLSRWEGEDVQFRFRYCTDQAVGESGWFVDDIAIEQLQPCAESPTFGQIYLEEVPGSACTDNDGLPDQDERLYLTARLFNYGAIATQQGTLTVTENSPYIDVISGPAQVASIPQDGGFVEARVEIEVTDNVPCDTDVTFDLVFDYQTAIIDEVFESPVNADRIEAPSIWVDDAETKANNLWTPGGLWDLVDDRAKSGSHSWYSGSIDSLCERLVSEPIRIASAGDALLTFWHWYQFEVNYDGGVVQVSVDDGESWVTLTPDNGYPGSTWQYTLSCLGINTDCFIGNSRGWRFETVDLSAYRGREIRIAFWVGNNTVNNEEGWYIDDINVLGAVQPTISCDVTPCASGDVDAPQMLAVNDWADESNLINYFEGDWTAQDNSGGPLEYMAAIGTQAGLNDAYGWFPLDTNTSLVLVSPTLPSDETYYLTVRAKDVAGNWSGSLSSDGVYIDYLAPDSLVFSPSSGATFNFPTVQVSGTSVDSGVGLDRVEISIDNGLNWLSANGTNNWSYTFNNLQPRVYRLLVRGIDKFGNVEDTGQPIRFTVGNPSPPSVLLGGFLDSDLEGKGGGDLRIGMLVSDPDSDIAEVQVLYGGVPTGLFLRDDGTNGDWNAGDGLFVLEIPGFSTGIPPQVLEIAVRSQDLGLLNSSPWPYLTVQGSTIGGR